MFVQLAVMAIVAGIYLYNRLTAPKQPPPIARTRDSLDLPRVDEGTGIPIVYGRNQVKSPLMSWVGDLNTKMGPDDAYITYGLNMLFVIGLPMGNGVARGNSLAGPLLHNVWMGDALLPSPGILPRAGSTIEYRKEVFQPSALGGPGRGGGLIGSYQWFGGWTDQDFRSPASPIGDFISNVIAAGQMPGHRRQMCVAFSYDPPVGSPYLNGTQQDGTGGTTSAFPLPDGFVLGENPSVNGFAFEVSSYGDNVFGNMTNPGFDFGGDADPMEVIYDLLTNAWGRVGLDPSVIDMPSFTAASSTLKAENHGISLVVYDTQDVAQVIQNVLQQINAAMYWEPNTGKYVVKLIRQDYVLASQPQFNESNIIDVTDYTFGNWRESINEVRVRYTSRFGGVIGGTGPYNIETAVASALANAVGNANRRRPKQIDYLGISNAFLASQVALRDLDILSTPLGKISMVVNRDGWSLRPGTVISVTFAEFGLFNVAFRVTNLDLGVFEDGKIKVEAIQDQFAASYNGVNQTAINPILPPTALANRIVVEAPRFLIQEAFHGGLINDNMSTRLLALPVKTSNGDGYYVNSQQTTSAASQLFSFLLQDIPFQPFPTSMQIQTAYSRALEPYDTTTGLVVNNLVGESALVFSGRVATSTTIANHGGNVLCIVRANGEQEIVAFETVTALGGGSYRLNHVWRGLLDTAALDHSVGEYCFMLVPNMVGRRAWSATKPISAQVVPTFSSSVGTGSDPVEQIPTTGPVLDPWSLTGDIKVGYVARAFRPLPVADFSVIGDGCQGTLGTPATAGRFKSISLLEEEVYLYGIKRELYNGSIIRGDSGVDDTLNSYSGYDWVVNCSPTGMFRPLWGQTHNPMGTISSGGSTSQSINAHYLVGAGAQFDWFGSIDIGMASRINILSSSPAVGKGGLQFGQLLTSYTDPRVTAFAPSWRNMVGNPRFDNTNIFVSAPYKWSINAGSAPTIGNNTGFNISGLASGKLSHYVVPGGTSMDLRSGVSISAWNARGLTAIGTGFMRMANGDLNDTGHLDLVDTGTGSASGTVTTPSGAHWQRVQTSMTITAMPSALQIVDVDIISTEVAGGGTANADVCWTEIALRIGRFQANVLANFDFATGTTASWTNITNSFVVGASTGPAAFTAQGGAFATSTIRQEFTLPSGWEIGSTVFLNCFRFQTTVGDTGSVTLSAIDGGGATLATGTTGVEEIAGLGWVKRTIFCDIPDGSVKIRVDLTANRASGVAASTAFFSVIDTWVAKDASPRNRINCDFNVPTAQPMPRNIAEFQLAYPTLPTPDVVLGGAHMNEEEMVWTDGVAHPIGVFTGQFGGVEVLTSPFQDKIVNYGTSSVDSYQFVRGTGAAAPHVAAQHRGYTVGKYSLTTPFTAAIFYKIDELNAFGGACGLIGRMDLGQGWGLELDASGHLTALLRGAGATSASVALARNGADGAVHMAVITYDGAGQLTVYDEVGSNTVSSAGIGEILGTSAACHLRLGRDADDRAVMPGQIARAMIWSVCLSSVQIAALWTYAADPNGRITTYTRSAAAWTTAPATTGGDVLFCAGPAQIAMPWHSALTFDDTGGGAGLGVGFGGFVDLDTRGTPGFVQSYRRTGHGLVVGRAVANRMPSWALTDANFTNETGIATPSILDNTGRYAGLGQIGISTTQGFVMKNVAVGAVARNVRLSFWARGNGADTFKVQLRDSTGSLILTSATQTLTTLWKRFDILLAYNGATATCQWRLIGAVGSLNFDLSSVIYSGEITTSNAQLPHLIPPPASSIGDTSAQIATTLPIQFNSEGEIVVTGTIGLAGDPGASSNAAATLVRVRNGSNTKNQRELLQLNTGPTIRLAHTDGTPATTNADCLLINSWSQVNKFRGRWDRLGLLDANGTFFAQSCANDQTTGAATAGNYSGAGRTVTWTNDTTQSTLIDIGAGTAPPEHTLITFIGVQAREEKLP